MSEQQLRKALGAVNDLEPPRDDLFAQRALGRGRARAHRRRSSVLGAAAGIAVVATVGGTWLAGVWPHPGGVAMPAGAPERAVGQQDLSSGGAPATNGVAPPKEAGPGVTSARDTTGWFTGPMTPARAAMESLAPTLEAGFPDVFAGAYAADAGNTRIVVAVTRADPRLEELVAAGLPAGTHVDYRTVTNSIQRLRQALGQVVGGQESWRAHGVEVLAARIDPRANRVVVTTRGGDPGAILAEVGADVVTIEVVADVPDGTDGTLPNGATLPTLQH